MPTYPSPKPTFCHKWEVSVNASLGGERGGGRGVAAKLIREFVEGAFHLSELTGQTLPVVTRITLLIKTIQPDQSIPE